MRVNMDGRRDGRPEPRMVVRCQCGRELALLTAGVVLVADGGTPVTYECAGCGHVTRARVSA